MSSKNLEDLKDACVVAQFDGSRADADHDVVGELAATTACRSRIAVTSQFVQKN